MFTAACCCLLTRIGDALHLMHFPFVHIHSYLLTYILICSHCFSYVHANTWTLLDYRTHSCAHIDFLACSVVCFSSFSFITRGQYRFRLRGSSGLCADGLCSLSVLSDVTSAWQRSLSLFCWRIPSIQTCPCIRVLYSDLAFIHDVVYTITPLGAFGECTTRRM